MAPKTMHSACLCTAVLWLFAACGGDVTRASSGSLKINGSTTVNPIAAETAEVLRERNGLVILVDTQGGSSGGVTLLGEGRVDIGMSSKPLGVSDRSRYPDIDFVQHRIGADAVALVVSADVWRDGVRSLSRSEVRGIYEGRITNWKDVGGPDRRIALFNKEPGRGTWEVFASWLYGSVQATPAVSFPEVGGNEETRNKVASTRGALSQLSYSWADRETVYPLGLEQGGKVVEPNLATISSGEYVMSRPLFLLTDGPPQGNAKLFIDYVLSPKGRSWSSGTAIWPSTNSPPRTWTGASLASRNPGEAGGVAGAGPRSAPTSSPASRWRASSRCWCCSAFRASPRGGTPGGVTSGAPSGSSGSSSSARAP